MKTTYPFAWLDELAEVKFNPAYPTDGNFDAELKELPARLRQLDCSLKCRSFATADQVEIESAVRQYATALQLLERQCLTNIRTKNISEYLVTCNETLLDQLEELRNKWLSRYPASWLDAIIPLPPLRKLLLRLSADQIAIMARAAYLVGLIDAASLRETFHLLSPFLRTEQVPDLSGESLRTHAAQPDQRDLDVAATVLELIAALIREPRRYFSQEVANLEDQLIEKLAKS